VRVRQACSLIPSCQSIAVSCLQANGVVPQLSCRGTFWD
jgi:hypothetical protein